MKTKFQKVSYWASISIVGIVVGITLQFAKAWTEPTVAPPGGNLGAPITSGTIAQTKNSYLNITGGGTYGTGGVGIGNQSLNSSGPWLYVGDSAGSVYGGQGIAMDNLYVQSLAYAGLIYDSNNSAYYLDPNVGSRMNVVVADSTYTYGNESVNDMYIRSSGKWASTIGNDNLGNHTATQSLNMNGKSITGAGMVIASNTFTYGNEDVNDIYIRSTGKWASSSMSGDNLGNHLATRNLDMGGNAIMNSSGITTNGIQVNTWLSTPKIMFPDGTTQTTAAASGSATGSLTENGWTKLPNGLIMQWGVIPVLDGDPSCAGLCSVVTLPIPFPNTILNVQVTQTNGATWIGYIYPSALRKTGITFSSQYIHSIVGYGTGSYFAIGY